MNVTLTRAYQSPFVTLGMLKIEGIDHRPIFTLENPWKKNQPFISRIPAGGYSCKPFNGNRYKNVYEVTNVEGRTYILFHSGNFEKDTNGCILLGLSAGELFGSPAVLQSRKAMKYFRSLIGRKSFNLTIKE